MSIGNINRENKVCIWIFCCKSTQTPNSVSEWQHFTEQDIYVKLAKSLSLWRKEENDLKSTWIWRGLVGKYAWKKKLPWSCFLQRIFNKKKKKIKKIHFWENTNHYCIFYRSNSLLFSASKKKKSSNVINFFLLLQAEILKWTEKIFSCRDLKLF